MNTEIEVKFPNLSHDSVRESLTKLGADCTTPNRLMRRVVIHTPDMTSRNAFVRIRDEGDKATITYKQFDADSIDGAKEYEIAVNSFEEAINIFTAAGLEYDTYQESRRETWTLDGAEIVLDEWPWLNPYIEVEGESEEVVRSVSKKLGFKWSDGQFGGIANLYLLQYPFIGKEGISTINQSWPVIRFEDEPPALITQK